MSCSTGKKLDALYCFLIPTSQ